MDERGKRPPAFEIIFIICGTWRIGLGLYFAFWRPALLPEDLRYIGASVQDIQAAVPGITGWLFKWLLLIPPALWLAGLISYQRHS